MYNKDEYVSLISSLPNPERLFLAKLPPISRLRLEQRLKQLNSEDLRVLQQVESVLDWGMQNIESTDQILIKYATQVCLDLRSETLKILVRNKMEMRTCIAALRHRMQGGKAPNSTHWGFGRWVSHINRHWGETYFALDVVFPWLPQAKEFLDKKDAQGMERFILEYAFKQLQRSADQHYFDLEAVIIYVLKWSIIDRASRYNTEAAKHRFTKLVEEGLGKFADPIFED